MELRAKNKFPPFWKRKHFHKNHKPIFPTNFSLNLPHSLPRRQPPCLRDELLCNIVDPVQDGLSKVTIVGVGMVGVACANALLFQVSRCSAAREFARQSSTAARLCLRALTPRTTHFVIAASF